MPKEKYRVKLTPEEVGILHDITHNGKNSAKTIMHANILLLTNDINPNRKTERELAELFGLSMTTINEIRKTYASSGLQAALQRNTRIGIPDIGFVNSIPSELKHPMFATSLGLLKHGIQSCEYAETCRTSSLPPTPPKQNSEKIKNQPKPPPKNSKNKTFLDSIKDFFDDLTEKTS